MIIDLIFAVLMVLAIIKGYRRGLIVAVFSFVAIIIGLAAAIKLSSIVANRLGHSVNISNKWLPVISFVIIFVVVILLIRLGAKAIEKLTRTIMLGWVNRLGGIILYAAIYTTVFSIVLFYAAQIKIIKPETIHASATYSFIQPWGPKAIDGLAVVFPFLKNVFSDLENFFGSVSTKLSMINF